MTILETTKGLRAHLIRYWDLANTWVMSSRSGYEGCLWEEFKRLHGIDTYGKYANEYIDQVFDPLMVLTIEGKERLLQKFDHAIANLEEHEVVVAPPPEVPCQTVMV